MNTPVIYSKEWYKTYNDQRAVEGQIKARDVSRLAAEIQLQFFQVTQDQALVEAERLVLKYGIGCSLLK
jgi:hypothetical protein